MRRPARRIVVAAAMAAAGHPSGVAIATHQPALWRGLAIAALVVGPALAIGALLARTTPLTRLVCMLAGTVCVNGIVAEVMLSLHRWSIPGGAAAVGVISAVLWLVPPDPRDDARGGASARSDIPPAVVDPRVVP